MNNLNYIEVRNIMLDFFLLCNHKQNKYIQCLGAAWVEPLIEAIVMAMSIVIVGFIT